MTRPKQPAFRTSMDPLAWVKQADQPAPLAPMAPPIQEAAPTTAPAAPKPQRMPWEGIDPKEHTQHLVRLGKVQKAQLVYIADHVPRSSVNSLIREGIDLAIAKHLKALKKAGDE